MYLVSTFTSDRQKWYTGPGRDVCSVMWHHAGRDSKGMEMKVLKCKSVKSAKVPAWP